MSELFAAARPVRIEDVNDDPPGPIPYARCPREPSGAYIPKRYSGKLQRAPKYVDEKGALCVIEQYFGGRLALFATPADPEFVRVVQLADKCRRCTHLHGGRAFGICLELAEDGEICPCNEVVR